MLCLPPKYISSSSCKQYLLLLFTHLPPLQRSSIADAIIGEDVMEWSEEDVAAWIRALPNEKLHAFADVMEEEGINGEALLAATVRHVLKRSRLPSTLLYLVRAVLRF